VIDHKFVSAKADGGDATLVRPSNWNDHHVELRTLSADATLPANSSSSVVGDYELGSGFVLELSADSVLEIS